MALLPQSVTDPVADAIFAHYKAKYGAEAQRPYLGASAIGKPCLRQHWYHSGGLSLRSSLAACTECSSLATYKSQGFIKTWQALAALSTRSTQLLASSGHSANQRLATTSKAMLTASLLVCRKRLSLRTYWR